MTSELHIATIKDIGYGLRDLPGKMPGLWFTVVWEGCCEALMVYMHGEAQAFILQHRISNVFDFNGKQCEIGVHGGHVTFLRFTDRIVEGTVGWYGETALEVAP